MPDADPSGKTTARSLRKSAIPIYFAYGANMDIEAMRRRCPASNPIGLARLMNHRFFIMRDGVASVRRAPGAVVHGLLWDLALADVRPLDRFEDVEGGLYTKMVQPVLKQAGAARALIYIGHTTDEGRSRPGYLEAVIGAARTVGLPDAYIRGLTALLPVRTRQASDRVGATVPSWPGLAEASRVKVTPRFATPFDRADLPPPLRGNPG